MTRSIRRNDFVDLFRNQQTAVEDVSRRNANLLTGEPIRDGAGNLLETTQIIDQSTDWQPIAFLQAMFTTLGSPLMICGRFRVSAISSTTTVRFSYMIDGVEVTNTTNGLGEINSLTFQPLLEITHIVTNVPAGQHSVLGVARLVDATGGKTATLFGGVQERITIVEVK